MQITSPGGVSNGSNISANGADASERLSSTIVFNSPNNFSTRPDEAVNLDFGVDIVRNIRFQNRESTDCSYRKDPFRGGSSTLMSYN